LFHIFLTTEICENISREKKCPFRFQCDLLLLASSQVEIIDTNGALHGAMLMRHAGLR
jgi:hypothetical protein